MTKGRWDTGSRASNDWRSIAAAVACGTVGVVVFGFFFYKALAEKPIQLDRTTLCPETVDSVTAILVDASDELSPLQRISVQNGLESVRDSVPKHGRIDLYVLGQQDEGIPRVLLSVCNPGTGEDADALTENARLIKKRWKRDFSDRLDQELGKALAGQEAQNSPIIEAVQAIAEQSFGNSASREASDKRLVVVSDMVQYAGTYNQYSGIRPDEFERFSATDQYRRIRPDLRGATVEVLYIQRPTRADVQGKNHLLFWEQLIRNSSGRMSRFDPVAG